MGFLWTNYFRFPVRILHPEMCDTKASLDAASQILMALGYSIMAMALPGSLHIGSILVGICYGVCVTITVPVASELFGVKYYGLLYNILILNLPLLWSPCWLYLRCSS
ncbi:protein NUCLEAR FUSION DEFECTIVE 4-like [Melia azedarach]|uniref:Protein NUCLEAR FUSION DEFECTIVE 4-like n=1 Tax=Melia azedarach TaxID=155640 RepID=A0ACC1XSQ1_MELAZ|nr:protein NUCLEAR FUSION DEFECTIVE 4-like [Melia azedarach]